ncbi:MAG: serine/threonine-protein kinase [Polyangiaceae bacterium]
MAGARVCPNCHALQPESRAPKIQKGVTIDRGYGRFVVDAQIGQGGMAIVWRAWLFYAPTDPRAGQPAQLVALKVLQEQMSNREAVQNFFLNEAKSLELLPHPNIVRFFELFSWPVPGARDSVQILAMEYVEGDTLADVIARHIARARLAGPTTSPGMALPRAWYYFQQLLGALAATHAIGVVHRDVKPSNVLIRKDGIVKLGDFGIAHMANMDTDGDMVPGTGAYMSPEQCLAHPLDGRSDLYSAATVLYEMLTGRTPFSIDGKSELFIRKEQVTATPPPIRTYLPNAPPVLDALFSKAFAKDPEQRFSNAIEMGTAFRDALGLPDTEEWRAQAELARQASAPTARAPEPGQPLKKMETLRDFLVARYRTMQMETRK